MHRPFEWPKAESDADEIIIRNVRQYGCHIVGVGGDEQHPEFAFSIGLFLNYQQAEVIIFGLSADISTAIINDVCARAADGERFGPGLCDKLLVGTDVHLVQVPLAAYQRYLGTAIWFYRSLPRPFPCLQIVWPDEAGKFPWDAEYDEHYRDVQPVLKVSTLQ